MIKYIICTVFCLFVASCHTNLLKYHKDIELGQKESVFLDKIDPDVDELEKYEASSGKLEQYTVYKGLVPSSFYWEKYLYIFKDGELVYYDHANRVAMHENEDYRLLAREAYEHFKEEE